MWNWPASLTADLKAAVAGWSTVRGGWRGAWRDAVELIADRRILVDTQAETRDGVRVVLRSRLRLSGDVQTDILRSWADSASPPSVEAVTAAHFRSVAAAVGGWRVADAVSRLASQLILLVGAVVWSASVVRSAFATGWGSFLPVLLTNRWSISWIAVAAFGLLLRCVLRLWARWKFRRGLAVGP